MTTSPLEHTAPAAAQLMKATALAAVVAAVILVVAVLPAEYGIDPTGVGRALGLTAMGAQKTEVAPAPPEQKAAPACISSTARATIAADGSRKDTIELVLPPKQGAEVKAFMKSGEPLTFSWSAGGAPVYFDFHGEAYDAPKDEFTSFETGTKAEASGTFRPPFAGRHGWYWRNDGAAPVTVRVETSGGYDDVKKM